MTVIEKIDEAVAMCTKREGRLPVFAFVGVDGYCDIQRLCQWQEKRFGRHILAVQTSAGPVEVRVRPTLFEAVIVEDDQGEPWIVP
jgi:hypothetical protein